MFLKRAFPLLVLCFGLLWGSCLMGQEPGGIEIDILTSYYDQDGDNSPVNGGVGDESLQSASPVFVVRYRTKADWLWSTRLGVDNVTSASIDAMDDNTGENNLDVSSASRKDNRAFTDISVSRETAMGTFGGHLGFSKEYDYRSLSGGFNWSKDFHDKNTTFAIGMNHFEDEIDVFNIHGVETGTDDRSTTDISISLTRVLSKRAVASFELFHIAQSGLLSSPFQEVILADGSHVAERLPDSRDRSGVRLSLNAALTQRVVTRSYLRFYDDDFGIQALTFEFEPHFQIGKGLQWLYPILRYHTQDGSDYWGLPQTFTAADPFYTVDRDLSEFDSTKLGLGWRTSRPGKRISSYDIRFTYYDRDDGLTSYNLSFGLGWRLK